MERHNAFQWTLPLPLLLDAPLDAAADARCVHSFMGRVPNLKGGSANLLFWSFSPENCVKLKKKKTRVGTLNAFSLSLEM